MLAGSSNRMTSPIYNDDIDRAIADLVLRGESNRAIARATDLPEGSVKWRLHRMYRRLGVETRTQFALKLRELNA